MVDSARPAAKRRASTRIPRVLDRQRTYRREPLFSRVPRRGVIPVRAQRARRRVERRLRLRLVGERMGALVRVLSPLARDRAITTAEASRTARALQRHRHGPLARAKPRRHRRRVHRPVSFPRRSNSASGDTSRAYSISRTSRAPPASRRRNRRSSGARRRRRRPRQASTRRRRRASRLSTVARQSAPRDGRPARVAHRRPRVRRARATASRVTSPCAISPPSATRGGFRGARRRTRRRAHAVATEVLRITPARANAAGSAAFAATKQLVVGGFVADFAFTVASPPDVEIPCEGVGSSAGDVFAARRRRGSRSSYKIRMSAPWEAVVGVRYGGIPNAVAVEFDTYHDAHSMDPYHNHVAVMTRGAKAPALASHTASLGSTVDVPNLSDGERHFVRVTYNPNFVVEDVAHKSFKSGSYLLDVMRDYEHRLGSRSKSSSTTSPRPRSPSPSISTRFSISITVERGSVSPPPPVVRCKTTTCGRSPFASDSTAVSIPRRRRSARQNARATN